MPEFNHIPTTRRSDRCSIMRARGNLRPDLAAFFVQASREPAPRQISNELGVLAELRAQAGTTAIGFGMAQPTDELRARS